MADGNEIPERHDDFPVSTEARTAIEDSGFESVNVLRVAGLATRYGLDSADRAREVADALSDLGVPASDDDLRPWDERAVRLPSVSESIEADRAQVWRRLNEGGGVDEANTFLVAVLTSRLERESAAAAAALWRITAETVTRDPVSDHEWLTRWVDVTTSRLVRQTSFPGGPDDGDLAQGTAPPVRWDPEEWRAICQAVAAGAREADQPGTNGLVRALAATRLRHALVSPDEITRSLAMAALLHHASDLDVGPVPAAERQQRATTVSALVHGTGAWKGDWWRPGSPFHDYVKSKHRADLFSLGTKFSWSGAYSERQREIASRDFGEWAAAVAPGGLRSVFAHSYGAEVAARAVRAGTRVDDLVLLSAPVTSHVLAGAARASRVIDVRLRFDPVLALARAHQRLRGRGLGQRLPAAPNVAEVVLRRWTLRHGCTHDERVWEEEDVAGRGAL